MRKEVTLDKEVIAKLEKKAKKAGRKLKNYMEQVLIEHVNCRNGVQDRRRNKK